MKFAFFRKEARMFVCKQSVRAIVIGLGMMGMYSINAKKMSATVRNTSDRPIEFILRATGCTKIMNGQTLVCEKKTVQPGGSDTVTTPALATGKLEIVAFQDSERFSTRKEVVEGSEVVWPDSFEMRTGGGVMLPGLTVYARLTVKNTTMEPIRAMIKRPGCADIRTEYGQTEGLLCANAQVPAQSSYTFEIKYPYRDDFNVIVFQQALDIQGTLDGHRWQTTHTFKHGQTVVWPTDFEDKPGFQQKADAAIESVGLLFAGIGMTIANIKTLVKDLKGAADTIKDKIEDYKKTKDVEVRTILISDMIDQVTPALGKIHNTVDMMSKFLIEPFDKDAYEKAQKAVVIIGSINELVGDVNRMIRELAPVIKDIEKSIKS